MCKFDFFDNLVPAAFYDFCNITYKYDLKSDIDSKYTLLYISICIHECRFIVNR